MDEITSPDPDPAPPPPAYTPNIIPPEIPHHTRPNTNANAANTVTNTNIPRKPVPVITQTELDTTTSEKPPDAHRRRQCPLFPRQLPTRATLLSRTERRYLNLPNRTLTFLTLALLSLLLILLPLILGLSIGLTRRHDSSSSSSSLPLPSSHSHFTGDLTYYSPALGACGVVSTDSDPVVSISHVVFDAAQSGTDPNSNPLCGLKIRARRVKEGQGGDAGEMRSVDLTVVDRCVGCLATDIDVSPGAFEKLADMTLGRVLVEWAWLDDDVPVEAEG